MDTLQTTEHMFCLRKGQPGSLILDSKCSNWMKINSICNAKESLCCMEGQETGIHVTKLREKVGMVLKKLCLVALYNKLLQNAQEQVHSSGSFASTQRGRLAVT